ncbi:MAG: PAS domain S-box protein [Sporocytophaga sp.]|uniref:PAS domain S-box protein n=1 Tax=Sporocytophaga sp. TaxID=2231183 RepID=UPI001B010AEC|nr:PAS domain S-box protein [Sporocytophaga sp.]MBO9701932.1 PAS domain S-box protein [Sporocytophaga sp.]
MKYFSSLKLLKKQQWEELQNKVVNLEEEISSATTFIKAIENGNLDDNGIKEVDLSSLTGSLVSMRNKMKVLAQEEKERNWVTEGLARFSEILRSNNKDLDGLSNQIISELIKYMGANQGGLYLINNNDESDVHIELIACYAYNKRKYLHQRIELGEGLLGQAALEKETTYMTDVPQSYVRITSGLGEALPKNIIIVPLKIDEEVYGLVELASFQTIKKHQVQFLEKLSESLASTIASVRTSVQTQMLLRESQMQAEQLRSQEEEMRQNMEELSSTQEAMTRNQQEVLEQSNKLNAILDSTVDAIITIDDSGRIETVNRSFSNLFGYTNEEVIGMNINMIVPSPHHEKHDQYIKNYMSTGQANIIGKTRQMEARRKDGSLFSVELSVNVAELGTRKIFTGILRDITERSKAEEERQNFLREVQKNEKEINELLNVSTDSIVVLDKRYKVLRFNRVYANAFSSLKIEKGFDIFTMFGTEEERKQKKEIYDQTFAGNMIESLDHISIGEYDNYFKVTHAPILDNEGKVSSIAIFASDITELHKAKEKAEQIAEEAQQQAEELRAQEEEIRQNLEELSATQEEMERILSDARKSEKEINELLNVSTDSIVVLDKNYKVLRFNRVYASAFSDLKIENGFDIFEMFATDEERKHKKKIYTQAFAGKLVESVDHINIGEYDNYFKVTHAPIVDNEGKVSSIAIFASDITELHNAKEKAEEIAERAQQQTEELRAQEEEIRQNMEELSATQEELERILSDVKKSEKEINELLNVSSDSILTLDKDFNVLRFNTVFANSFSSLNIQKGYNILNMFITEDEKVQKKNIYSEAFTGKVVESVDHINVGEFDNYFKVKHAPLFDENGKVTSIAIYASDITELYKAKEKAERFASNAQKQTEDLKAQEEELRQNLEEMHAMQEALNKKNEEIEKIQSAERERADSVIQSQKINLQNIVAKFKQLESDYKNRIAELEKKSSSKK